MPRRRQLDQEQHRGRQTVDAYAATWLESRRLRGISSAAYEATLYNRVWKPVLGSLEIGAKGVVPLVRGVLEHAAAGQLVAPVRANRKGKPRRYSRQSIVHMRAVVHRLFDAMWKDELIADNPVARVSVRKWSRTRRRAPS